MIDAAWSLFRERGYDHTTVDDIARAADVSPRTFFRYFATKDDVLFARLDDVLAQLGARLQARPAGEPVWVGVREAAIAYVDDLGPDFASARVIFDIVPTSPALTARYLQSFARMESIVAEWVAARLDVPPTDLDSRIIAGAGIAAARIGVDQWLSRTGSPNLADHVRAALDALESAVSDGPVPGSNSSTKRPHKP
jgi:AcrR family transcriptional regulator